MLPRRRPGFIDQGSSLPKRLSSPFASTVARFAGSTDYIPTVSKENEGREKESSLAGNEKHKRGPISARKSTRIHKEERLSLNNKSFRIAYLPPKKARGWFEANKTETALGFPENRPSMASFASSTCRTELTTTGDVGGKSGVVLGKIKVYGVAGFQPRGPNVNAFPPWCDTSTSAKIGSKWRSSSSLSSSSSSSSLLSTSLSSSLTTAVATAAVAAAAAAEKTAKAKATARGKSPSFSVSSSTEGGELFCMKKKNNLLVWLSNYSLDSLAGSLKKAGITSCEKLLSLEKSAAIDVVHNCASKRCRPRFQVMLRDMQRAEETPSDTEEIYGTELYNSIGNEVNSLSINENKKKTAMPEKNQMRSVNAISYTMPLSTKRGPEVLCVLRNFEKGHEPPSTQQKREGSSETLASILCTSLNNNESTCNLKDGRDLNFAILMEERFRKHSARLMQGATIRHRQKEMLKESKREREN